MKSVQRKFGTFTKRSENEADVQIVLAEFKAMDDMLERVRMWFNLDSRQSTNKVDS